MKYLEKIIDIISDAISILDFSYIISGSIAYIILFLTLYLGNDDFINNIKECPETFFIIGSVVTAYVLGLFVGNAGLRLRKIIGIIKKDCWFHFDEEKLWKELWDDNKTMSSKEVTINITDIPANTANTYLWTLLSQDEKVKDRLQFINRFWVMQKVYEGLAIDALFAIIPTSKCFCDNKTYWGIIVGTIILLIIMSIIFLYEACANARYQRNEIVSLYFCSQIPIEKRDKQEPATPTENPTE